MNKNLICALFLMTMCLWGPQAFAMENPDVEGWVVKIDNDKNVIRVLSANHEPDKVQRDWHVNVKPGHISDYHLNDYVQVKFREDLPYALMIEKSSPRVG